MIHTQCDYVCSDVMYNNNNNNNNILRPSVWDYLGEVQHSTIHTSYSRMKKNPYLHSTARQCAITKADIKQKLLPVSNEDYVMCKYCIHLETKHLHHVHQSIHTVPSYLKQLTTNIPGYIKNAK